MSKTVLDLRIGEQGVIKALKEESMTCTLLTLGITPETTISLIRKSPLGSALCIRIGDTDVAIRKKEAQSIILK